jgi:hypothetical protein
MKMKIFIALLCLIAAAFMFYATKTAHDDGANSSATPLSENNYTTPSTTTTPSENNNTGQSDGEIIEAPSNRVFSFEFFKRSSSNITEPDDNETDSFFVVDTTPPPFDMAALEQIDKLTKEIGAEGELPDDIWISPRLLTEDIYAQKDILEKIIILGNKISDGSASRAEGKMYYDLKIALLTDKKAVLEEHHADMEEQFSSGSLPEDKINPLNEDTQSEIMKQYATMKKLIDNKIAEFNLNKENL